MPSAQAARRYYGWILVVRRQYSRDENRSCITTGAVPRLLTGSHGDLYPRPKQPTPYRASPGSPESVGGVVLGGHNAVVISSSARRFRPPTYGVLGAVINSAGSISILNVNGTEVGADNVRPLSFVRHKPNLV